MYHVELRKFPKRVHRFNMNGEQVGAILLPWVHERVIELGEQKWSPHEAEITVLEGPEIAPSEISMGRGWRIAQREGRDVTTQVLAEASASGRDWTGAEPAPVAGALGTPPSGDGEDLALAMRLGSLLGPEPQRLMEAWSDVRRREPSLSPSAALAAAEREISGS